MKRSGIAVGLAAAVVLGGCGTAAGGAGGAPSGRRAAGDAAVVLRVEQSNESMGARNRLSFLPETTVYADGRVVQQAPLTLASVAENPALPAMIEWSLTPEGLNALVERARAAGVGSGADLGEPPVMDAPTTHFTLNAGQERAGTDAYALRVSAGLNVPVGEPEPSPSIPAGSGRGDGTLTAEQADARYKLLDLAAALADLPAALGAGRVGQHEPYQPRALAVVATPTPIDQELGDPVHWPGPALPGQEALSDTGSCTVVRGADLASVLDAAERAQRWTPWSEGGRTCYLDFRPLLPDESTCEDLTAPLPHSP